MKNSLLNELIQMKEVPFCSEMINVILFSNNDSLNEPIELYKDCLDKAKMFFKSKYKTDPILFIKYKRIVNKISKFLDTLVEKDDYISKYYILLYLINNGYLSGKKLTTESSKYLDNYDCFGLDAILGNCCCRHEGSLIQDVLKNNNPTIRLGIGNSTFQKANHCILAVYDYEINKYILLDSVKRMLYNSKQNLEIINSKNQIKYIKANYSITYFSDFNNVNDFLEFFENIQFSRLSKSEIKYIYYKFELNHKIYMKMFESDFEDFSEYIKPERESIIRLIKR